MISQACSGTLTAGDSPLMNTINSAANARSAKVKSDLLMGLNAGVRPERLGMKEQPQQPLSSLSEEHASILSNLNNGLRMGTQFGSANTGGAYSAAAGDYPPSRPSSQYEGLSMNGVYGNNPMMSLSISMPMSSTGSGGTMSVSGPPPGLGLLPSSSNNNNNSSNNGNGGNDNGGMVASYMSGNNNSNINKPLDITSMMSTLDFFGPSPSSPMPSPISGSSNNNSGSWSLLSNGTGLGGGHGFHQEPMSSSNSSSSQGGPGMLSRRESAQSNTGLHLNGGVPQQQQQQQAGGNNVPNGHNHSHVNSDSPNMTQSTTTNLGNVTSPGAAASAPGTARSADDLELQVINAKMETQMLENQLNAVIKRNRRKLYA
ncbi:hypothetical protein BGZ65_005980 [Modicella reniformis]|uniref:Uncharacterized protein n=1 Tax=Modicella reniformis TaxID=1440133 RepID=A0A9P6ST80_9FUNG|nr:hypothetical protein BGZ65_005980 [Modicella reniformis]